MLEGRRDTFFYTDVLDKNFANQARINMSRELGMLERGTWIGFDAPTEASSGLKGQNTFAGAIDDATIFPRRTRS